MRALTSIVLFLSLVAGAGSTPASVGGGSDLQVVAGADAACALVARPACRPTFDWPELVADLTSACSDPHAGGVWFQVFTRSSCRGGATPLATRSRGPPALRS